MKSFHQIASRRKCRRQEKYKYLLLMGEKKLQEIPRDLLRDPSVCTTLYISGFRADRGISREQYEDDLSFLRREMLLAEIEENMALKSELESSYKFVYSIYEAKYLET